MLQCFNASMLQCFNVNFLLPHLITLSHNFLKIRDKFNTIVLIFTFVNQKVTII